MERGNNTILSNALSLLWQRQRVLYLCVLLTCGMALLYYAVAGERYEAYTILRSGQGIKERGTTSSPALTEGIDLQSRLESLSRIAKIDTVIQEAARSTGYDRLLSDSNTTWLAQFLGWAKDIGFLGSKDDKPDQDSPAAKAAALERNENTILALRDRVVAKQEGRSDLLKITFRHSDPSIAATYLNELANALVAVQNTEVQMPGAQEFFQQQTKRLEGEADEAATALENFSVKASIYSVDEQRQLLLKRANDIAAQMSTTRGTIEERKGQKQAIVDQLQVLRPVYQSRTVSNMVKSLGGQDSRKASEITTKDQTEQQFDGTPPLLLVKVYQDNMAALMKVNADLNGSTEMLNQLGAELESVNKELASLSSKEAEYARLKRVFTTSSSAAAHYANRILEEQISSEVAKKVQLSSLRVVQRAIPPTSPMFPQPPHLAILALLGGVLLGFAAIFGPELAKGSIRLPEGRDSGVGDDDPVKLLLVARQRKEAAKDLHSAQAAQ